MEKPVVSVKNVSKTYSLFKRKSDQLLELFSLNRNKKSFSALSNISFDVFRGETIGIIGINGSGKSTLSSILAQVTQPSTGKIDIQGETSLVAISAGLNNFLTGIENIELKCLMHGLSKKEIKNITPEIIEFADIGEFINQPIKSYSSGMKSRLGFAISVHIQPDILVIDEALSVGDSTFYQKCLDKISEFKEQNKTIFFISHSLSQVQSVSDRILWLNFGQVEMFDDKDIVAEEYNKFILWFNNLDKDGKKEYRQIMLKSQINKESSVTKNKTLLRKGRNIKGKINTIIQFSLILIYFLIASILMFIDDPLSVITGQNNTRNESIMLEEEVGKDVPVEALNYEDSITVNQDGLIKGRSAPIYSDTKFSEILTELPFATRTYVIEEVNNSVYKIESVYGSGYVEKEVIHLLDADKLRVDVTLDEFLPIFPDSVREAYSFFFSFLNAEAETIKEGLQGLTNEFDDDNGNRILEYGFESISYILDDEDTSYGIIISDLNLSEYSSLTTNTSLILEGDGIFYYQSDTYKIFLDSINNTIRFENY